MAQSQYICCSQIIEIIFYYQMQKIIDVIRRLKPNEIDLLQRLYGRHLPKIHLQKQPSVYWYNLFSDGKFFIQQDSLTKEFHKWTSLLMTEIYPQQKQHLLKYEFLVNPANAEKPQEYHIDYGQTVESIFITMVPHTSENATQFLPRPIAIAPYEGPYGMTRYGTSDLHLLERSGLDYIEVSQLICKPFTIVRQSAGVIHRGIANRGKDDRPIFIMTTSSQPRLINEGQTVKTQFTT